MRRIALFAFALNPILWASFYTAAKPGIIETDPLCFQLSSCSGLFRWGSSSSPA